MSLSSPAVPPVADASAVANTQQNFNTSAAQQSQQGSMVNQSNPYGTLSYTQTGTNANGTPIYSANTQLSQAQQGLLNTLQGNQATAGNQAGALLTGANYGGQDPSTVIGNATSGNTQALLNQETSYLNPFFSTQRSQLDTQLRNQGFAPGQPGYDNAMRGLDTNQGQTVTGFLASAEPAAYSQAVQSYQMPLSMAQQELGLSQPGSVGANLVQTPQLSVQPSNYAGDVANQQQAQQAQYQAQLAQQNAMMSGLFGIGGSVLGGLAKGGFTNPFSKTT
jgi:hypothetical protein